MKAWWAARSSRERWIVGIAALLAVFLLGYSRVWRPMEQSRQRLRAQLVQAEQDLAWMRSVTPAQLAKQVIAVPVNGASLLARLDSGARGAGLGNALLQVEPMAADAVRLHFVQVDFDALVRWLETQRSAGIEVREMGVQREPDSGRAEVRVLMVEKG